jgi:sugar phosphate permease
MSDIEKKASLDRADTSPAADQLEHVQTKEGGSHVFIRPSAQEEAAVIRKLDWRLLPIVFLLYSLAVLDRSNLGNARLAGMEDDIDLSGDRYNLLGTVFYIAYIFSQYVSLFPSSFLLSSPLAFISLSLVT